MPEEEEAHVLLTLYQNSYSIEQQKTETRQRFGDNETF